MARRKAEVVEQAFPTEEMDAESMANARALQAEASLAAGLAGLADAREGWRERNACRAANLDALTARMSAIPSMTDRAAINALAEAVADLARLMR